MSQLVASIVSDCLVCTKAKYDRHPRKQVLGKTPIPSLIGETLHINIFSTDRKFSKFAIVQPIDSRTIADIEPAIMQLMNFYPWVKTIYCDNEPSMNSQSIRSLLLNRFNVTVENAPPLHSISNGHVERFHSKLVEIARCLKLERGLDDTVNLLLQVAIEYNKTVHSVTNKRPIDIIHAMPAEEITKWN